VRLSVSYRFAWNAAWYLPLALPARSPAPDVVLPDSVFSGDRAGYSSRSAHVLEPRDSLLFLQARVTRDR
jgi:hypothetical protein